MAELGQHGGKNNGRETATIREEGDNMRDRDRVHARESWVVEGKRLCKREGGKRSMK